MGQLHITFHYIEICNKLDSILLQITITPSLPLGLLFKLDLNKSFEKSKRHRHEHK